MASASLCNWQMAKATFSEFVRTLLLLYTTILRLSKKDDLGRCSVKKAFGFALRTDLRSATAQSCLVNPKAFSVTLTQS
ncbi:hypothetical protein C4F40_16085 [Sphingobacterium sp. Ka21]|uniref:Secreted protein n=1 Tax=Sphingobacterium pedocola TaxID=2082722 RepID=A0ABR9TA70_9SPHI|nr:hypothetical protein [Sphingobacterium pedocola]